MNNDLISRKELRKAFKKSPVFTKAILYYARQLIDDAPAVELDEDDIQSLLNKRCMTVVTNELLKDLNYDRDQYAKGYADAKKDYERTWIKLIDNESDSLIDRVTYEDNLIDHNFYLIAHKDFGTPLKAQYHSDFPHFTFSVSGREYAEYVYDGKITHYMELPELPWKEEE